jgi:hypothetical protein
MTPLVGICTPSLVRNDMRDPAAPPGEMTRVAGSNGVAQSRWHLPMRLSRSRRRGFGYFSLPGSCPPIRSPPGHDASRRFIRSRTRELCSGHLGPPPISGTCRLTPCSHRRTGSRAAAPVAPQSALKRRLIHHPETFAGRSPAMRSVAPDPTLYYAPTAPRFYLFISHPHLRTTLLIRKPVFRTRSPLFE